MLQASDTSSKFHRRGNEFPACREDTAFTVIYADPSQILTSGRSEDRK